MEKLKVGVLISGRGSNLQALIDAAEADGYPAEIAIVISNIAGVHGLERAEKAGIPTQVVSHKDYDDRESFEDALHAVLREHGVQLVCLAGFMRLVTDHFIADWNNRVLNIHPSLLPAFKGLHVHERVLEAGMRISGCTVHFVRAAMDAGPVVVQAAVPVLGDDTPETLAERVVRQEHRVFPLAVRLIAEGRVKVVDEKVLIDGAEAPEDALVNPLPD